jgi:hypothetical protein
VGLQALEHRSCAGDPIAHHGDHPGTLLAQAQRLPREGVAQVGVGPDPDQPRRLGGIEASREHRVGPVGLRQAMQVVPRPGGGHGQDAPGQWDLVPPQLSDAG